jgi:monoamine oxidase
MSPIIIIGAGAAGLSAATALSKIGKKVVVIEARDRIGGRIFTSHERNFSIPIENGAEFIHGDPSHTQALAGSAGVKLNEDSGTEWHLENGEQQESGFFDPNWAKLIRELKSLDHDMSIAQFLNVHFSDGKYETLRDSVTRFVEGFDAADAQKASAFALRDEWTETDATKGYHIVGGYSTLMDHLFVQCKTNDVDFHFSSVVKEIYRNHEKVTVICGNGDRHDGQKVLVTIPPAVLKSGAVEFFPEPKKYLDALSKIETGGVIKFLVEFRSAEWDNAGNGNFRQFPDAHFIFSDAWIPTWWTQPSAKVPLLTGWLSGPVTTKLKMTEEELLNEAVKSLAYIFDCPERTLRSNIRAMKVVNWVDDPFARGAYAYKTVETNEAIDVLSSPLDEQVYFAGEAYYKGAAMGTVEAALVSGENAAALMALPSTVRS